MKVRLELEVELRDVLALANYFKQTTSTQATLGGSYYSPEANEAVGRILEQVRREVER